MRPPSRHAAFFSSLKQVEKRLASESSSSNSSNPSQNPLFSPPTTATDNLSSPIYLNYPQPNNNTTTTNSLGLQESDPPQDFLSHSIEFPPTPQNPSQSHTPKCNQITNTSSDDEIAHLMGLLGLSDGREGGGDLIKGSSCFCNGGFYSKIAGVKGPKCEKESRRLEGWIGYFLNRGGGERREPLRLAHLLLAKAACLDVSDDDGFGGIEFPSTVEEFLNHDPPPLPPHQHN
ncbi:hypothetical protein MRB53_015690 [Persea americana]|uniref:Uncharacterized protein n=1 Tax=Persea americana TaxID=3435 RepID=A0ACC2LZR9_PERAE|nr:hypothetical protein MRB53_015690 [Persea americana]|eukprot:TRINITY_DN23767_c1_g1_i1.p1 TRINITY_DN23767_c1_g1~~TRINITY_DN23767_c1_g1_i1.p1  ORF type:complete len:232 (+),score=69.23 TRINITY_DN23767_c1_g1_i1:172-867(+)